MTREGTDIRIITSLAGSGKFQNAAFARSVTLRQLLTHTAGAGDFMGPEFDAHRAELRNLKDYVAMFGGRPGEFPPGSRWSYANFGYIILGRVIEVASGQRYADYIQGHIFVPAGMTHSGLGDPPAGLARGYVKGPQGLTPGAPVDVDSHLRWRRLVHR